MAGFGCPERVLPRSAHAGSEFVFLMLSGAAEEIQAPNGGGITGFNKMTRRLKQLL